MFKSQFKITSDKSVDVLQKLLTPEYIKQLTTRLPEHLFNPVQLTYINNILTLILGMRVRPYRYLLFPRIIVTGEIKQDGGKAFIEGDFRFSIKFSLFLKVSLLIISIAYLWVILYVLGGAAVSALLNYFSVVFSGKLPTHAQTLSCLNTISLPFIIALACIAPLFLCYVWTYFLHRILAMRILRKLVNDPTESLPAQLDGSLDRKKPK